MDLDKLSALIDLCRAKGVTALEADGVKLVLGPVPVEAKAQPSRPAPAPRSPIEEIEDLEKRILGRRMAMGEVAPKQVT